MYTRDSLQALTLFEVIPGTELKRSHPCWSVLGDEKQFLCFKGGRVGLSATCSIDPDLLILKLHRLWNGKFLSCPATVSLSWEFKDLVSRTSSYLNSATFLQGPVEVWGSLTNVAVVVDAYGL